MLVRIIAISHHALTPTPHPFVVTNVVGRLDEKWPAVGARYDKEGGMGGRRGAIALAFLISEHHVVGVTVLPTTMALCPASLGSACLIMLPS